MVVDTVTNAEELLTMAQVTIVLNVHPNTVRRWEKIGYLPCIRIGPRRDRRFRRSDINALADSSGIVPDFVSIDLTDRQRSILQLVLNGQTNKEIAKSLSLNIASVVSTIMCLRRRFRVLSKGKLRELLLGESIDRKRLHVRDN